MRALSYTSHLNFDRSFYRIFAALLVAIASRALNAFCGNLFCDSAISTSSIIGILPGFLICQYSVSAFLNHFGANAGRTVSSALDVSSKNIRSGGVKLVFAVVYVFVLVRTPTFG